MRLTTFILIATIMQVSATSFAQKVSLSANNTRLREVFSEIRKQTGYDFVFTTKTLKNAKLVTITARNLDVSEVLEKIFDGQPLTYTISNKTVVVQPEETSFLERISSVISNMVRNIDVRGRVVDEKGNPLIGATVKIKGSTKGTTTSAEGVFTLSNVDENAVLVIQYLGYKIKEVTVSEDMGDISMELSVGELEEVSVVVNTGYQSLAKERATGSFVHINTERLQRNVAPNILSRLEGITSGLQFDRSNSRNESGQTELRVRGTSTILSDLTPLIVLNDFPFEGDIEDINPNDVESVTVLKDAAAASIWGARAGNGVIVITTKNGKYNQPLNVNLTSNINLSERPNLSYNRNFIPSSDWLGIEDYLHSKSFYDADGTGIIPPYAEQLILRDNAEITETELAAIREQYSKIDVRDEAGKYLYQRGVHQQYALNLFGGGERNRYYVSAGIDKDRANVIGNGNRRLTLSARNEWKISPSTDLSGAFYYSSERSEQNGLTLEGISPTGLGVLPYTSLRGEDGQALPILRNYRLPYIANATNTGLLDWYYRPLDEVGLSDRFNQSERTRLDGNLTQRLWKGLSASLRYQYQLKNGLRHLHYDKNSYYVRDLVNRFTQSDGTKIIPYGGVLQEGNDREETHYGRFQLDYNRQIGAHHELAAIAGAEVRQEHYVTQPGYQTYNYDGEVLTGTMIFDYTKYYPTRPQSSARIPSNPYTAGDITDRNLSYYSNLSYTYKGKYTLSGSSRWDGSNLFGVKTNQKGVPLWSTGVAWDMSKEKWYRLGWLSYLRTRATLGYNGNVNRRVSAYPTFQSATNSTTGLPFGIVTNPGNPSLRWEKVRVLNLAIDAATKNKRLSGSLEYYRKKASDLIGELFMDPTTGLSNIRNLINYGRMETYGLDLQLNSMNIERGKFSWQSSWLLSYVSSRVIEYDVDAALPAYAAYLSQSPIVEAGSSPDALYGLPWSGLSSENGQPLVRIDGTITQEYTDFLNGLSRGDILKLGVGVPRWHGGLLNTFRWGALSLSANIGWKADYVFRRTSINYSQLFDMGQGNIDYLKRWQQSGDELNTTVPAIPEALDRNRETVYAYSDMLVTSGAHIRLQDIRFSYRLTKLDFKRMPFEELTLSAYGQNLGIIWRENGFGIDPDYPYAPYPAQPSIAFGINVRF